jgi:hypothetical protein
VWSLLRGSVLGGDEARFLRFRPLVSFALSVSNRALKIGRPALVVEPPDR